MVYNYKRKTDRGSGWTEDDMATAINSVKNGEMSIRRASVQFGIKFSTLQKHVKSNKTQKILGRYKPVFSAQVENEFVEYIKELDNRFYGLTKRDLCELAYQYALKNKIEHPFRNNMAGEQWYHNFMARHPDLRLRQPEPTSIARARGFNRPQVELFFKNLRNAIDKYKISVDNIYNVDETGIQTSAKKPPKVISITGKKQVGSISSAERGTLITALFCCSATGRYIPPTLVFPRKKRNPRYLNGCPPGTLDLVTDNGWITTDAFLEWLRFFVQSVRPSNGHKCLLILDNHASHRAINVLDYAYENNVVILTVPPHTTHRLQPLDVAVYGPFGKYFQSAIDRWQKAHPSQHVSFFDIGEIFCEAYLKAATPVNAINGFRKTGIIDCNIDVFTDVDFLPSLVTEIEEAQIENLENNQMLANLNPFTNISGQDVEDITDCSMNTEMAHSKNHPSTSRCVFPLSPEKNPCTQDEPNNFKDKKISITEIRAIPKCQNRGKKVTKRRSQKSEVLTSTPVKEEIRNQGQSSQKKREVKRKILDDQPTLKIPKKPKEKFSPEEKNVPCLLCGDTFGNSASGEKWVQCNICQNWAHALCSDYKTGVFICDRCRQEILSSRQK